MLRGEHAFVAAEAQNASSEKSEDTNEAPSEQGVNYKEQFLRVTADFNNYQRRVAKERSQWMQSAQVSIIESFLPLIDDVERALAATDGKELGEAGSAVAEGVALMAKNVQINYMGGTE